MVLFSEFSGVIDVIEQRYLRWDDSSGSQNKGKFNPRTQLGGVAAAAGCRSS